MKNVLSVSLVALALTACHTMPCHDTDDHARAHDSTNPKLTVVAGSVGDVIVVDQDPLVFRPDQKNVVITWHLPKQEGYRFPKNGIVFQGQDNHDGTDGRPEFDECHPSESRIEYTCTNRHTILGKRYKYSINVEKIVTGGGVRVLEEDPFVQN